MSWRSFAQLVLGLLAFGLLVWPGLYVYGRLGPHSPVRTNRVTGAAWILRDDGWQLLKPAVLPTPGPLVGGIVDDLGILDDPPSSKTP